MTNRCGVSKPGLAGVALKYAAAVWPWSNTIVWLSLLSTRYRATVVVVSGGAMTTERISTFGPNCAFTCSRFFDSARQCGQSVFMKSSNSHFPR